MPLTEIRNLRHLKITAWCCYPVSRLISIMLIKSSATLESLDISAQDRRTAFMDRWEDDVEAFHPRTDEQVPKLTSLKSISLSGFLLTDELGRNLLQTIDFLKIEELRIGKFHFSSLESRNGRRMPTYEPMNFFRQLDDLFRRANKRDIHLRHLALDVSSHRRRSRCDPKEALVDVYNFISSFDMLISLEMYDHNMYSRKEGLDSGLDPLLQLAIQNHKDLEILRFRYTHLAPITIKIPCFTAASVKTLTATLPKLRVLEFCPSGDDKVDRFPSLPTTYLYTKTV
ncbi:hypothetical protein ACHAPK_011470 [Fusarium culmorum]